MAKKDDGLPSGARNDEPVVVTVDTGAAGADATAVVTVDGVAIAGVVGERPDDALPGERQPLPIPEGGWPPDEFTGAAGCFVRDPFTGVRSRAVE